MYKGSVRLDAPMLYAIGFLFLFTIGGLTVPVAVVPMRKTEFAYKQDHPFEKRVAEAARIREKYPDRIPVICEKDVGSDIPAVDKRKYLIPMDLTVGQFVYVIRKRISIPSDKAIFIFVNNSLPPTAALMSTVYEQHKDQDGFMYMMYSGENTFGSATELLEEGSP